MEKMKKVKTIDEYISLFPRDVQAVLEKIRQTVRNAAPKAEETISYGIPTFKLNGFLVHFGGYESHIGFYPTSSGVRAFQKDLAKYEGSKGTVRFPLNEPIPFDLIGRITKYRVKENLKRKKTP